MEVNQTDEVKVIYKYMNSKYVKDFLEKGSLQIGTIEYYKTFDHAEIGDPLEGMKSGKTVVEEGTFRDGAPLPGALGELLGANLALGGGIEFHNVSAIVDTTLANAYAFCATEVPNKASMIKCGYDACIKINNPLQFAKIIGMKLHKQRLINPNFVAMLCKYEGKVSDYYAKDDYWLKPEHLKHQAEYRIVYNPIPGKEIKEIVIECRELTPLLELYSL